MRDATSALRALLDGPAAERAALVAPALDELLEVRLRARGGMDTGDFAERTAGLARGAALNFQFAISDLDRKVGDASGELNWDRTSRRRSGIEAIRELYAGHIPEDDLPDASELDQTLRDAAPLYGPAREIPSQIPRSDWWWWAPADPPTDTAAHD